MNGEREARFWSNMKKAFREFDHDEMTYATQALMGIYDVLEDIRAILRDIHGDARDHGSVEGVETMRLKGEDAYKSFKRDLAKDMGERWMD